MANVTLTAEAGSYTLTGSDATLAHSRVLIGASGSYTLSGQAASLTRSRVLLGGAGNYEIVPGNTYLYYSGEADVLLQVDWTSSLIKILQPTTVVDAQTLHDFIEDAMSTPEGMYYDDIIKPEGKIADPSNPGVYSQIILIFNPPWQIQFWQGSGYTRIYGGKIVGGLNDQPIKATGFAGDITVLESPVDGLAIAGGGGGTGDLTQQALDAIADAVWDETLDDHQTPGSTGEAMKKAAGAKKGVYKY